MLRSLQDAIEESLLEDVETESQATVFPRVLATPVKVAQTIRERPADQVHVLGQDFKGSFIAHALSGSSAVPPPKVLFHVGHLLRTFKFEGAGITVVQDGERSTRNRVVREWVGGTQDEPIREHIEQLVVTAPCFQAVRLISNVRHRIDHRSTILLLQDGLGVVEELNKALFADPRSRPTYVLGHMTHSFGHEKGRTFTMTEAVRGRLFLSALPRGSSYSLIRFHPPIERQPRATNLIKTLSTTAGLNAGGYSLEEFLLKKLPSMVFHSVTDTLSVVLDFSYDKLLDNEYRLSLIDQLLDEIYNVIMSLPELPNASKIVDRMSKDKLRRDIVRKLRSKGYDESRMLHRVRAGRMVDVDYLNGYFVSRGKELGIKCPTNEMMMKLVKAKLSKRRKEIEGAIPFELA